MISYDHADNVSPDFRNNGRMYTNFKTGNDWLGPFELVLICEISNWEFLQMSTNFLGVTVFGPEVMFLLD